ncbi:MAG: tRNA-dihydrouridine synthase [Candidatus Doudnabacteria bacterium]|nr:tRNA-dihydrouridine synthase [Candidatus Doudnabacteria bacterium]
MNSGFWSKLKKPILVLAPMANVTDEAFRRVIAKYGKPDITWTEFVSCDGLCSEGLERLLPDFWYSESERPIVAQIFGATPENFYKTAQLVKELKFDGIDINMGCPDKSVLKQGAGASLINNPQLAKDIITATREGAGDLPVSIKTRIGDTKNTLDTWLPMLLAEEPAAITIHARTRKEMSLVPANWSAVKQAVEIAKGSGTLILGNGDVENIEQADRKVQETGADGIMIGRGIFGNPWLFSGRKKEDIPLDERLKVMLEHTYLFQELFKDIKNFDIMKKHYKAYVNNFSGASEMRARLFETKNAEQVAQIVKEHFAVTV